MSRPARWLASFGRAIGFPATGYRASEKLVATAGGILSVFFVLVISRALLGPQVAVVIVPSIGASAVLIFAIPHSPLTQPWGVIGGHVISAAIGVACARWIPEPLLAAALAVGFAIGIMHLARCLHPPGGATALTAVIGGSSIQALGYAYLFTPVLINCLIILVIGVAFNFAFPWRRYPSSLMRYVAVPHSPHSWPRVGEPHIREAIERLNVVVDISSDELAELIDQTLHLAENSARRKSHIRLGAFYGNGKHGRHWSIRQVIDERPSGRPEMDLVVFQVMAGSGKGRRGCCTRDEFADWAASEMHYRG